MKPAFSAPLGPSWTSLHAIFQGNRSSTGYTFVNDSHSPIGRLSSRSFWSRWIDRDVAHGFCACLRPTFPETSLVLIRSTGCLPMTTMTIQCQSSPHRSICPRNLARSTSARVPLLPQLTEKLSRRGKIRLYVLYMFPLRCPVEAAAATAVSSSSSSVGAELEYT